MEIKKEDIAKKIQEKGATLPCHRCGHGNFTILDGIAKISLQPNLDGFMLGGMAVPTVMIACNNCGTITHHALGALGLLPNDTGAN